jgi:hypothetical protein
MKNQVQMYVSTSPRCKNCQYNANLNGGKLRFCDYLGYTGRMRGTSVAECDKFKTKKQLTPRQMSLRASGHPIE